MNVRVAILACLFAASSGYLAFAMEPEPVPVRLSLTALDNQLGRWTGQRLVPLADDVVTVLGVDDYVNRAYRASPSEVVSLYIGYYESQRNGDTIHSPMNCLPGAGWQPVEVSYVDVPVPGRDMPVRVKQVVIEKGLERQLVLYWYQSHGRVEANEYWSKVLMVYDAIRFHRSDAAMIRVVTPIVGGEDVSVAAGRATEFVQALFPRLDSHLPS